MIPGGPTGVIDIAVRAGMNHFGSQGYMDSFFGDQVRLAEVASEACLSPYHFHRLFREVFRETPNQYLQRKRLANARQLLERGEQGVTDICLEVGFESITSFSALFRRSFGCSPREYRFRKNKTR
jgi:AraC-like DNA-binding protein